MTELDVCDQHYVGFSGDADCAVCNMYYSLEVAGELLTKIIKCSFTPKGMRADIGVALKDIQASLDCIRAAKGTL